MNKNRLPESREIYLYTCSRLDEPGFIQEESYLQFMPDGLVIGWELDEEYWRPLIPGDTAWFHHRGGGECILFLSPNRTGRFQPGDIVQLIEPFGDACGISTIQGVVNFLAKPSTRRQRA